MVAEVPYLLIFYKGREDFEREQAERAENPTAARKYTQKQGIQV